MEGRQAVREALLAGRRPIREIWISTAAEPARVLEEIRELARDARVPVHDVAPRRFDAAARTGAHQGVLARAAPLPEADLEDLIAGSGGPPLLLAVDGVTDPGNLGALLRVAEAAGVTGVVLPRHRAAHITPAVTKAAAGAVEHLPMTVVGGLPAALARLAEAGVWSVGLDPAGTTDVHEVGVATEPLVVVVGAEGSGLSRLVRERCDVLARIPMRGRLASLNVATAAAVALFAFSHRRHAAG